MRQAICKVKSRSRRHSRGIVPLSQQAWESPSHQPPSTFGKENATAAAASAVAEVPWIDTCIMPNRPDNVDEGCEEETQGAR